MASDLEPRVTALETTVQTLGDRVRTTEHDAATALLLAGGAQRDIIQTRDELRTDLKSFREQNNRLHNATRQDVTDLRGEVTDLRGEVTDLRGEVTDLRQTVEKGFAEIDQKFAQVNQGFAEVGKGFANVRGRLDATAAGQEQIVVLLNHLINQDAEGA
jgi:predicted  nucleic acid-binding Zn-ribbon protein